MLSEQSIFRLRHKKSTWSAYLAERLDFKVTSRDKMQMADRAGRVWRVIFSVSAGFIIHQA